MNRRLIADVMRHVVAETQRKIPTLTKRLVIVTAVSGTGVARRATYKLDPDDTSTYPPAVCLDSWTPGTLPQTCVALIDGGDVLIIGAPG